MTDIQQIFQSKQIYNVTIHELADYILKLKKKDKDGIFPD